MELEVTAIEKGIASNWRVVKLKDLCKEKDGLRRGPFGSAIKKEFFVQDGYKVYEQSNAIYDDVERGNYFIDGDKYQELINFNVVPGDLIVSCSGTLGRIAEIPTNAKPGVINQALLRVRLLDNIISKKFFLYYFRSATFQRKILVQSQGTAMSNLIGIKDLKEIEFILPPVSEQQEIVAKIEELFSELDKGKEQLETALKQLKVYRQAVLKWAFEGKFTNGEVKDGELTEGWKTVKLGDVSKVSGGLTKNSKRENLPLKLPFLRVANVYFNRIDLTDVHLVGVNENEIERVKLQKYDLLFVEGNGSIDQIGRVALWDGSIENCVHQNHLIKSRLQGELLPKYALHYFCSSVGRQRIKEQANSTSGLHTLNLTKISNLHIPLPSLEEQDQIVQEIESRLSICDKVEETITKGIQQAETLRQSVLKKAFEGSLVKTANAKFTEQVNQLKEKVAQTDQYQISFRQ